MPVVDGTKEREREVRRRAADVFDRSADGRRPRAAGRHVAQSRPELRQGVRHHLPGARQVRPARLGHVMGRLDAPDRRRDHGARRRQRPRAAAAHRAVSGGHRADRPRQLAGDRPAARAGDPGAAGRRRHPRHARRARRAARLEVFRVGDARRAAAHRDRAEGHREIAGAHRPPRHAREGRRADGRARGARARTCWTTFSGTCSTAR